MNCIAMIHNLIFDGNRRFLFYFIVYKSLLSYIYYVYRILYSVYSRIKL